MLVTACEETLGVRGPTALARLTGRSKSWWSKLVGGTAPFPDWEELEGWLPSGLTAVEREQLHGRYRKAWLWLYDPVLLDRLDSPLPPRATFEELDALRTTAGVMAHHQGDHRTALRLMTLSELLLVPRGIEALSPEELGLLRDSLNLQSICERELRNFETAMAVAHRSVRYQQTGRSQAGEAVARHELGIAQQGAGIHSHARFFAKALDTLEEVQREFERLNLTLYAIAARRDIGSTQLFMRRWEEAEGELLRAYEMPQQTGESRFRTAVWLIDVSIQRGNGEQARRWLARTRAIASRYPDEIAALMSVRYMAHAVTQMERAVAQLGFQRKR